MTSSARILLVAVAAGTLGVVVSLLATGPAPLLRSEWGRRLYAIVQPAQAPAGADVAVARRGERIPELRLTALDGRAVSLPTAFAGRPILVNVWASWCAPCAAEMPALQQFAREQAGNGVQVVGIALDEPAAVRDFVARLGIKYPILMDRPGPMDAGVRLGDPAGVLPYSVLVSADGRLLRSRIGPFAAGELQAWTRP
jgi:thiol-disulfide isomerase/thioredoxin